MRINHVFSYKFVHFSAAGARCHPWQQSPPVKGGGGRGWKLNISLPNFCGENIKNEKKKRLSLSSIRKACVRRSMVDGRWPMADGRWPRWQRATVLRPLLWSPPNPHPLIFFYLSMVSDPNWPCVLGTSIRSHFPKRVQGYPSPQSPKGGGGRDNSGGSRSLPNKALSVSFIWRTNYLPSQCGGSLHMAIGRPACKSTDWWW